MSSSTARRSQGGLHGPSWKVTGLIPVEGAFRWRRARERYAEDAQLQGKRGVVADEGAELEDARTADGSDSLVVGGVRKIVGHQRVGGQRDCSLANRKAAVVAVTQRTQLVCGRPACRPTASCAYHSKSESQCTLTTRVATSRARSDSAVS